MNLQGLNKTVFRVGFRITNKSPDMLLLDQSIDSSKETINNINDFEIKIWQNKVQYGDYYMGSIFLNINHITNIDIKNYKDEINNLYEFPIYKHHVRIS